MMFLVNFHVEFGKARIHLVFFTVEMSNSSSIADIISMGSLLGFECFWEWYER